MFNNRGLDILKLYKNALTINLLFTFGSGPNVTTYIENNKETQASVSVRTISTVTSPTDISMINPLNSSYIYKLDTGTPIISNASVPSAKPVRPGKVANRKSRSLAVIV
jgi:hypothetical protein